MTTDIAEQMEREAKRLKDTYGHSYVSLMFTDGESIFTVSVGMYGPIIRNRSLAKAIRMAEDCFNDRPITSIVS